MNTDTMADIIGDIERAVEQVKEDHANGSDPKEAYVRALYSLLDAVRMLAHEDAPIEPMVVAE